MDPAKINDMDAVAAHWKARIEAHNAELKAKRGEAGKKAAMTRKSNKAKKHFDSHFYRMFKGDYLTVQEALLLEATE
ncbi:hypothetical protein [Mycobacterium sp.]|uniref:hypothetical protein n=1 Tax=Mycobacterium sp. TaxID=1785 RepID=UPI003F949C89